MSAEGITKQNKASAAASTHSGLPLSLTFLLASAAGLAVAALYYSQPMLGVLGADIGASTQAVGLLPTLTQLGYALGILFLAPLGDRHDRRRIILAKAAILCAALLLAAVSPSLTSLLAASLVIGLAATMAQDIVPAAATLAPETHRGKIVGTVMTGLLLGILLSRVVSGFVAEHWGWRAMFAVAAASIALVGLAAWRQLPRFQPTTQLPYLALLKSLGSLWKQHAALRRATWAQGLLSIGFSAFWSTLAVMLHGEPFHLGAAAAGAFGLAGAAGALAAPVAGRIADRYGAPLVTRLGAGLVFIFFAAMALAPLMGSGAQLGLLVVCAIGFDLGIQASLIAHQTIIYGIDANARSRLNAVLFTGMFIGMAIGSALAALLFAEFGWMAVTVLATTSALWALILRLRG
ncbi:MFS transporter [Ottowia thiooxydans]|uniref:MFS transporter n=1 Tax=Ottowia thiooxydans TaxID=219182 RepID=UPI0003F6C004|nr:MFS transporter [Ottowia thiooxydans]